MKITARRFLSNAFLWLACGLFWTLRAAAAAASSDPSDPGDKHIYVGQYDLCTNLWGIRGAGNSWHAYIFTNSVSDMSGSGYEWSGFDGDLNSVKAYTSLRYGASNKQNIVSVSGLPYLFDNNHKDVDVSWDFKTTDEDGTGNIVGKYNHTLDIFFNATASTQQAEIRGEIMVIADSSQNARTAGWGVRDAQAFVMDGENWEVWQATQKSNGHSWHVTQFRKRENTEHFSHNLKNFFADAAARRPDIFRSDYYVMMVEAGTEIKTGSGKVYNSRYSVNVH